ncbi:MAG: hypothetical protein QM572_15635 [Nocardioides sp.]|uniref:hypothetical protein n=1 Tax=Nocardioides sp. TaxID=35761 RepID=UPI0039E51D85
MRTPMGIASRSGWGPGLLALAAVGLLALGGCGGSEDASPSPGSSSSAPDAAAGTPSASVEPAADGVPPAFCDLLTPEEIGDALGAPVTVETGPLGECEFGQEDPREISGSLGTAELAEAASGFEVYRHGTSSAMDSPSEHTIGGLGDGAFLTLGTVGGGENLHLAGGVLHGTVVFTVNLSQGAGHTEDELVAVGEKLLKLEYDAAG